ncbi:hypothetical protein PMIT1306_01493 [Prochlorococcus sp. MIT 1306]|nr:hypothetical protein PMIT1306_01493 [Prochlorococcus sp. MIT 1306]
MAVNAPRTNHVQIILRLLIATFYKLRIVRIALPSLAISLVHFPLAALLTIHRIKTTFIFAENNSYL